MSSKEQNLQNFIRLVTTAAANATLYSLDHLQVARLTRQAYDELLVLLRSDQEVILKVIDKQLIFANQPVVQKIAVTRLISALAQHDISHLRITAGVREEELIELVNILSKRPTRTIDLNASNHIHYSQVEVRYRTEEEGQQAPEQLLDEIAETEADRFMDLYQSARNHQQLDISNVSEIVSGFVDAFSEHGHAFLALAPLRSMDEYTYTHSTNICLLNLAQARQLGIEGEQLNEIGIAAMLHDVGKMFIPPAILSKAGQLDDEEWQIMQQHPQLGAEYLLSTPGVPRLAVLTAYEHHMGYSGQGYPKTKRPWQMHLCSHMTAISDTYDAMRTRRSYEDSLELDFIINTMLELAGSKLHPQLTYSFLQLLNFMEHEQENA